MRTTTTIIINIWLKIFFGFVYYFISEFLFENFHYGMEEMLVQNHFYRKYASKIRRNVNAAAISPIRRRTVGNTATAWRQQRAQSHAICH